MEEIIGLLILLVPSIFSLISKKLNKAGKDATVDVPGVPADVEPDIVVEEAPEPKRKPRKSSFKAQAVEEEKSSRKDPIDPKKLVIYSELMKPKFKE